MTTRTTTRKKHRWNIKTFLSNLWTMALLCLIVWFMASWVDIWMHNLSGGSDAGWNLINILMRLFGANV